LNGIGITVDSYVIKKKGEENIVPPGVDIIHLHPCKLHQVKDQVGEKINGIGQEEITHPAEGELVGKRHLLYDKPLVLLIKTQTEHAIYKEAYQSKGKIPGIEIGVEYAVHQVILLKNHSVGDEYNKTPGDVKKEWKKMNPVFARKTKAGTEQVGKIKINGRAHEQGMLQGHIKKKIATVHAFVSIVPAAESQHPGTDIQNRAKEKECQPVLRCRPVAKAFLQ